MEIVKKTKILFLVTQSEMGGAQRYIYEIGHALDKEKYEVLVATGEGDGELFRKLATLGIESRKLEQMKRTPWPWQISSAVWAERTSCSKKVMEVLFFSLL